MTDKELKTEPQMNKKSEQNVVDSSDCIKKIKLHHKHLSHSPRRKRRKKKGNSVLKKIQHWFDKKFGRRSFLAINLVAIFITILLLGTLIVVNMLANQNRPLLGDEGSSNTGETTNNGGWMPSVSKDFQIKLSYFSEDVVIISEAANVYLSADASARIDSIIERYGTSARMDIGKPVTLSFEVVSQPEGYEDGMLRVIVSENSAFSSFREWTLQKSQGKVEIYNLKTATTYYYRVYFGDTEHFVQGMFRTADTRRFMNIAGINNVRDIGGLKTIDGKRIKQGILYRGSELDGAVEPSYLLQFEGRNTMLEIMGIRFDMDLREPSGVDALGAGVTHVNYGAYQYEGIFTSEGKATMRAVFADLANASNYPIYLHCTYGRDRTGTVCYLLEGLLGVNDADLIRDYELSTLYGAAITRDTLQPLIDGLSLYDGETTQQRIENYLLSIGVTAEEIANIRAIFLE